MGGRIFLKIRKSKKIYQLQARIFRFVDLYIRPLALDIRQQTFTIEMHILTLSMETFPLGVFLDLSIRIRPGTKFYNKNNQRRSLRPEDRGLYSSIDLESLPKPKLKSVAKSLRQNHLQRLKNFPTGLEIPPAPREGGIRNNPALGCNSWTLLGNLLIIHMSVERKAALQNRSDLGAWST